jgi:hypothetical protein
MATANRQTLSRLEAQLAYWQLLLRLRDWRIDIVLTDVQDLGPGRLARVDWALIQKHATVRLLDPAADAAHDDLEMSLVHELIHLHLAPIGVEDGTAEDMAQETAIEMLAGALVELRRGGAALIK